MKLNIDANVIKSPLQSEFVIADRIQLETDSLSIMLNAIDINVPINNINTGTFNEFRYEGRQKEGNWMAYWVAVKAKDLIELYPHIHAHLPGAVRNQTPYDFQMSIGYGIEPLKAFERDPNQPASRYIEVNAVEAGSEELAVRQVLSAVAGQLLTSHRDNAHFVNMISVHIAEQLIHLGMTHFKQGDLKFNGFLRTHNGLVQTERMWRLGNPGTGKLSLRQTLLTQQTGPNTRTTHLVNADDHQVYGIDGKYEQPNGSMNAGFMPGFNSFTGGNQGHYNTPGYAQQYGMPAGPLSSDGPNYQPMNMPMQFGMEPGMNPMQQLANSAPNQSVTMPGVKPLMEHTPEELRKLMPSMYGNVSDKVETAPVPAINNRTLTESDLGPRNEDTPIVGKVVSIEVAPVLITEDTASVVTDGSHNAYGVYRREKQDDTTLAVHIGDFLSADLAVKYAIKMGKFFNVYVDDYVSAPPVEANE